MFVVFLCQALTPLAYTPNQSDYTYRTQTYSDYLYVLMHTSHISFPLRAGGIAYEYLSLSHPAHHLCIIKTPKPYQPETLVCCYKRQQGIEPCTNTLASGPVVPDHHSLMYSTFVTRFGLFARQV